MSRGISEGSPTTFTLGFVDFFHLLGRAQELYGPTLVLTRLVVHVEEGKGSSVEVGYGFSNGLFNVHGSMMVGRKEKVEKKIFPTFGHFITMLISVGFDLFTFVSKPFSFSISRKGPDRF